MGCQMDEFKPEDELKSDPSDRPGRSRKSVDTEHEPQLNIDDIDLDDDMDDRRRGRGRPKQDEAPDDEWYDDSADGSVAPRRRAAPSRNASRQRIMMGVGILVLLVLVIGIGAALKSPTDSTTAQNSGGGERNIDLSNNSPEPSTPQNDGNSTPASNNEAGQEVSLPAVSDTPTESANSGVAPAQQSRVELQGDLGNALSGQQESGGVQLADNNAPVDGMSSSSSLPTQPATVASVSGSSNDQSAPVARTESQAVEPRRKVTQPARTATTRPAESTARRTTTQAAAPAREHHTSAPKQDVQTAAKAPTRAVETPVSRQASSTASSSAPAATKTQTQSSASAAVSSNTSVGNIGALKSAPGSNYTLQLSSSSNFNNLNSWAKKSNLQNYVVYQTQRNGKPWYVLVSGVYPSKDAARKAVASLPADVQAKNPWTKPIHQVQADLK